MGFIKHVLRSWLPVGVAFVLGGLFVGTASGHRGFPDFLHAGHSDTMNGVLTTKGFRFNRPKTVRLVVPGGSFVASRDDEDILDHGGYSGFVRLELEERAVAGISLPHGAVVKSLTMFYDGSSSAGGTLQLEASDSMRGHLDMAQVTSGAGPCPNPCSVSDTSVNPDNINNLTRHYGLTLLAPATGNIDLYKAVIVYTVKVPGPAAS